MRIRLLGLILVPLGAAAAPAPLQPVQPTGDVASAESQAARALATVSAGEPDVAELQRAAARVADAAGAEAVDHPTRARLAGLLPHFTTEYRHEQASNRVVGLQGSGEVDYLRLQPCDTFLVRATWDLPVLMAAPGELTAGAQQQARAKRREEAVERVTKLFFERRRLQVALLLSPPTDPVGRAQVEIDVERLGAEIDALTGSRFRERTP
jgi:hypothetical protein